MTPDERQTALGQYIREAADGLGLRDWSFTLLAESADEGNNAQIATVYGRKQACMKFQHRWWNEPPEDLRHTVIHELLHCHMDGMDTAINGAEELLGRAAWHMLEHAHHAATELAVDAIADVLALGWALPPDFAAIMNEESDD